METINLGRVAFVYKGDYYAGTTYNKMDVVFDGESSFVSQIDNNVGNPLVNGLNWKYLSRGNNLELQEAKQDIATLETNLNADIAAMYPAVPYAKRVTADGGQIASKEITEEMYQKMLDLLPNTKVLFCPQTGMKTRASGANLYASKLYDMSANNNDAVQATEANQPFVVGNIATNERRGVKYLLKQTQNGLLDHTDVSFLSTESWSVILALKANRKANTILTLGNCYVEFTQSGITLTRGSTVVLYGPHSIVLGATNILEFQYSNGFGVIKVNGEPVATAVTASAITFGQLYFNSSFPLDGAVYYYSVFNKRLQESESEALYKYLRTVYPDIEGVDIGNQHWATSNYEGVVTGNGTVIPEVPYASTAISPELITIAADRTFDVGNNWKVTGLASIANGIANIKSIDGSDSTITLSSVMIAGKTYSITYEVIANRGGVLSTNIMAAGNPILDSTVGVHTLIATVVTSTLSFKRYGVADIDIDNISVKEVGWTDLTTPAWCYYNNDPLLGAIYGKLYNWYAVAEIAKNPPKGWRVPTSADFTQLVNYLGGASVAGGKMKKEGLVYWNYPNTGATNESGFSGIGSGVRSGITGSFSSNKNVSVFYNSNNTSRYIVNSSILFPQGSESGLDGACVRLIRVPPVGDQVQRLTTGIFTTNIASGVSDKLLSIPFGYRVTDITVKSALALTNVVCTMYNYDNTTLQGTLLTGKSVAAGAEVNFATNYDAAIQYQDPVLRFNATGNGGDGMEILVTIQKVLV